jgi:hypothetical protein
MIKIKNKYLKLKKIIKEENREKKREWESNMKGEKNEGVELKKKTN